MSSPDNNMTIAGPRAKGLLGTGGLYLIWQLEQDLKALKRTRPNTVILEGEANGIDGAARDLGRENGFRINPHPVTDAEWKASRGAGYARNQTMVDKSARVRIYWNGLSRGTRHTLSISFTVNKLERLVLWNGVIWQQGISQWHPLEYGENMNANHEYYLSLALAERLRRNMTSKAMKDGADINLLRLAYANARARDAFTWLCQVGNIPVIIQAAEVESDEAHIGWYRFPSKGRKGKYHYTAPGASECTCEGWHPELVGRAPESRQVCWHMMATWQWDYMQKHILPQFHPLDVSVVEQLEERLYQYAA